MNTKKVFLLLNGAPPNKLPDLKEYAVVCATDGAYLFLKDNNIIPDFISGDLDSLSSIPKDIEVIHTPNQDFTDFDKMLKILFEKGFETVDVYGASGQEQDHFLGNLHTAMQWEDRLKLNFYDDFSRYFLAKKQLTINNCYNKVVSLVPFPKVTGLTTIGLEFSLLNEELVFGERIGTRNKAIENQVKVSFITGNLFVFINH